MKIYLVGGAVRDILIGKTPKDLDYVVVGATEDEMIRQGFQKVGRLFPVFIHPKTKHEYALARKEIKKGKGHKGFSFKFSPDVTLEEDLFRRDLTINAMAMDQDTQEIFDYHSGQKDIENKVLRHVSPHFIEDPLRVLRVARFHSQLPDFTIDSETMEIMKKISISKELKTLSSERVLEELTKALLNPGPNLFFQALTDSEAINELFPLLHSLKGRQTNSLGISDWDYALKSLLLAKEFNFSADLLFSVFFQVFGKEEKEKNIEMLEVFLKEIRLPQKAKSLSLLTARNLQIGHNLQNLPPKDILALLKRLKAFHKETSILPDFLKCLEIDYKIMNGKEDPLKVSSWLFPLANRLRKMDFKSLEKKFEGAELGAEIDKTREEVILSWPRN